jgi:hypothetical protein
MGKKSLEKNSRNVLRRVLRNSRKESRKSSSPVFNSITPTSTTSNLKLDPNEPPTKLIKLINGSAILTSPMDKDNKMVHQGQLTLQQVIRWLVFVLRHSTDIEGFAGCWRRWACG